jgi:hypothetical protein
MTFVLTKAAHVARRSSTLTAKARQRRPLTADERMAKVYKLPWTTNEAKQFLIDHSEELAGAMLTAGLRVVTKGLKAGK